MLKVIFFLIIIGVLIYFIVRFLSNQTRQSVRGLPLRLIRGVWKNVQLLSEITDEEEVEAWLTFGQAKQTQSKLRYRLFYLKRGAEIKGKWKALIPYLKNSCHK